MKDGWAASHRAKGLCVNCKLPVVPGKQMCQLHRETANRRLREQRAERRARGKCYKCETDALPGISTCQKHLDQQHQGVKRYIERHGQRKINEDAVRRRNTLRPKGLCIDCEEQVVPGRRRCARHLEASREACSKYQHTDKGKAVLARSYHKNKHKHVERKRRYGEGVGRFIRAKASTTWRRGEGEWPITEEEYATLVSCPCFYCLFPLMPSGTGLDRIDNKHGYHLSNVVSACADCNIARNDRFTLEEMQVIGLAIREVKLERAHAEASIEDRTRSVG